MKSKLGVTILTVILLLLASRSTEAAKSETALLDIAKYELRLKRIEQRLESINPPIQQMGPETADAFEVGIDDVQMSFDEVSERLAMIRFIVDREGSAPEDKRDLAYTELKFLEADVVDLEEQSSFIANEVDAVVWY